MCWEEPAVQLISLWSSVLLFVVEVTVGWQCASAEQVHGEPWPPAPPGWGHSGWNAVQISSTAPAAVCLSLEWSHEYMDVAWLLLGDPWLRNGYCKCPLLSDSLKDWYIKVLSYLPMRFSVVHCREHKKFNAKFNKHVFGCLSSSLTSESNKLQPSECSGQRAWLSSQQDSFCSQQGMPWAPTLSMFVLAWCASGNCQRDRSKTTQSLHATPGTSCLSMFCLANNLAHNLLFWN